VGLLFPTNLPNPCGHKDLVPRLVPVLHKVQDCSNMQGLTSPSKVPILEPPLTPLPPNDLQELKGVLAKTCKEGAKLSRGNDLQAF